MKTLYLCGAGNSEGVRLALAVNEASRRWQRLALLDDDPSKWGHKLLGVEVVGGFSLLDDAPPGTEVANLVARTTAGRLAARARVARSGLPFAPLVSPTVDTRGAELARDVIVYHNATIGPESSVADGSVVFMGAVVGHESHVGRGCVLAANSVINARVELGEGVYVGTNATVLPEVRVGAGATIGAGSVVLENVPDGATVMGVPARILTGPAERHAAPAPPRSSHAATRGSPELESTLQRIWEEVLDTSDVKRDDNFFDLGGSSLLALRLYERVERECGMRLDPIDLFRFPTVRTLARHLAPGLREHPPPGGGPQRAAFRRQMVRHRAGLGPD